MGRVQGISGRGSTLNRTTFGIFLGALVAAELRSRSCEHLLSDLAATLNLQP